MVLFKPKETRYKDELQAAADTFRRYSSKTITSHTAKPISTLGWSSDGRRLATGSTDRTAKIWSVTQTGDLRSPTDCIGHSESVLQLCWDPTHPDRFATASTDKTVRIWDARTATCSHVIKTRGENINLAWSPGGDSIAVGDKDDHITYIETKHFTPTKTFRPSDEFGEINEVGWNPTGELFFLTTGTGHILVMDFEKAELITTRRAHTGSCYCVEVDDTNSYLATGGADALMTIWDTKELSCLYTLDTKNAAVRTLSFTYDGAYIACGTESGVDIAHVRSGQRVFQTAENQQMNALAWSPRDYVLAYAAETYPGKFFRYGGQIQLFSLSSQLT